MPNSAQSLINRRSRRNTVQNNIYRASPIQTGAAPCKARPTDHCSVFTSTRVGTSMPRYALSLPNLLQPPKPTTPATPNAPCCTARWPNTSRPGLSWQASASSRARATTTRRPRMSRGLFASIWSVASLPTALALLPAARQGCTQRGTAYLPARSARKFARPLPRRCED